VSEPSNRAQRLQDLLGLSDEELIRTLDASALELLSGELDHRPEIGILLDLLADAEERTGAPMLARWLRASGPARRAGRRAHRARLSPPSRPPSTILPSAGSS